MEGEVMEVLFTENAPEIRAHIRLTATCASIVMIVSTAR